MSQRLAKEHFITAIDDPELELKVREKEPQTLDAAVMYAQRLETFKYSVRQRHQRYVRRVSASPDSRSTSSVERIVKRDHSQSKSRQGRHESSNQGCQRDNEARLSSKYNKKEGRNDNKRTRATTVTNDEKWKEELHKKVQELELNQQKVTPLNKEVERLRYLEQLRSVPAPASTSAVAPVVRPLLPPGSASQQRLCYTCNNPGHYANNCLQNHTRLTYGPRKSLHRDQEPYLRVVIDNQMYDCLLDTGSQVSLFPGSIIGSAGVESTNKTLKAANGLDIPIHGEVSK